MGSFFTDILSFQHETAVFDVNPHQLRFVYNTYRFTTLGGNQGVRAGTGHQCRYGEIHWTPSAKCCQYCLRTASSVTLLR